MKILVVGGGGREHALAWRLSQSPKAQFVYVAPGNGGTSADPNLKNLPITDIKVLVAFAKREAIQLTVVGPETPLANGIVDAFRAEGLRIFGPTRKAAQLESSKDFAKAFMKRHGIPTANYETFSDAQAAHTAIDARGAPIVIKTDGLAAGKGVVVAQTLDEAHRAVDAMLPESRKGKTSARIIVEDFLEGEEASFIVMVDGQHILPLATSQDHKRLLDQDLGPNTGGMGAYSPAPAVTPEIHARIMREIIQPTVQGMAKEGMPYTGFLYAGVMIDSNGAPRTLEFNCRMGDPETQPIMARLKTDFVSVCEHGIAGTLDRITLEWDRRFALGVVMAAQGYPDTPRTGDRIEGIPPACDDAFIFHAGTVRVGDVVKTSGGRVLCVVGLGDNVRMAQKRAYEIVSGVHFEGAQYRRDIGWRALARKH